MKILETERLILRELVESDDAFILDLLNQPSFIKYIGDRQVRDLEQARNFIETRYRQSYREHGFGLYAVELKSEINFSESEIRNPKSEIRNRSVGICGFVRRAGLEDSDIGFAFLPQFEGRGYAFESSAAMMNHGREKLGFKRVLAITTLDNESSIKLLKKLGFEFQNTIILPGGTEELRLFSAEF